MLASTRAAGYFIKDNSMKSIYYASLSTKGEDDVSKLSQSSGQKGVIWKLHKEKCYTFLTLEHVSAPIFYPTFSAQLSFPNRSSKQTPKLFQELCNVIKRRFLCSRLL